MTTFFVGGCMRSGTSVLQAVLCSTNDTNPLIHEAQYFTRIIQLYRYGKETFERYQCHYFDELKDLKAFHAELARLYLESTLERYRPAAHLVLKNPEMTPLFADIRELVDNAKFIVSVRDPQDTIASIINVTRRQAKLGQVTTLTRMAGDMKKHAAHHNWYYGPLFNNRNPNLMKRLLIVKYEDLVLDLAAVAKTLAEFTGLPLQGYDASQPWWTLVDYSDERLASEPFQSELRGKPLSKTKIGQHTHMFTKKNIQIIEQSCRPFMDAFGYAS